MRNYYHRHMIRTIKNSIIWAIKKALFNYERPRYSTFIYHLSRQYVNYYNGDGNANMSTNGEQRFLESMVKDGMVVFDVGANIGEYSDRVLKISKNVAIHCFEPDKDIFDKINLSGVTKVNRAVSDAVGTRPFFRNQTHPALSSFYDMRAETSPAYESVMPVAIETTTLDVYCGERGIKHIDLLKIDVEGHELSVLRGAEGLIESRAIDVIQFEFGHAAIFARTFLKDLFDFFEKYGYEIYKIKPLGLERKEYTPEEERCSYANFIAKKS